MKNNNVKENPYIKYKQILKKYYIRLEKIQFKKYNCAIPDQGMTNWMLFDVTKNYTGFIIVLKKLKKQGT